MFMWERAAVAAQQSDGLLAEFSPAEVAQLAILQRKARALQLREQGLDERRLEFARWLVRTGRLSEEIAADVAQAA